MLTFVAQNHPCGMFADFRGILVRYFAHNAPSGYRQGKRRIWGGRASLRRCLNLAALTASRFDPRFKAFKDRLIDAGKPRKVAIIACARKLLTVLNAMERTGKAYIEAEI